VDGHAVLLKETRCGSSGFRRHHIALLSFSRWCVVFFLVAGLLTSGCVYKKDLEKAELQLSQVTNENKVISDQITGLRQEKIKLTDEVALSKKESEDLKIKIDTLKRLNTEFEQDAKKLGQDLETSKRENIKLTTELKSTAKEIEELKKRIADLPTNRSEQPFQRGSAQAIAKPTENLTPCDSVLEFMRTSEQVIRSYKGDERHKLLDKVKSDYAEKWNGAPKKAIDSAQAWVKEMSKSWDKHHEGTVFLLLKHKNSVLKACGKDDSQAGF
jgi:DNA repair exonuclease SbcCD ATPase subunit